MISQKFPGVNMYVTMEFPFFETSETIMMIIEYIEYSYLKKKIFFVLLILL